MSTVLTLRQIEFLRRRQFAHVATVNPDGSPQVTALWVDTDGEAVLLNTALGRVKARNLESDPRIAISIVDSENPYDSLTIQGRAELIEEGGVEHIRFLSQKYTGDPDFTLQPGERRVIIRVLPERVGGAVR
jgi:PPOX class probable F420-dependent enzyme